MKKRSLFAAIAMLVISAIVLTSTTYAWFSLSSNAQVAQVSATVQAASGLELSADQTNWYSTLTNAHINAALGNNVTLPSQLVACDYNGSSTLFTTNGTIQNDALTTKNATANTEYVHFTVYLRATEGKTINFTQTSGGSTIAGTGSVGTVGYVSLKYIEDPSVSNAQTTDHIYAAEAAASSYNAFSNTVVAAPLVNGIVTDTSTGKADTPMSALSNATFANQTIKIPDDGDNVVESGIAQIEVTMWIEGQDANCYGDFTDGDLQLNLKFAIAS